MACFVLAFVKLRKQKFPLVGNPIITAIRYYAAYNKTLRGADYDCKIDIYYWHFDPKMLLKFCF